MQKYSYFIYLQIFLHLFYEEIYTIILKC